MNLLNKFHHWRRKRRWNKQYRKGRWESLKKPIEAGRYNQIKALIEQHGTANGSILDIGCGDGVLNSYLDASTFSHFLGLDFSKVSIEKARAHGFEKSEFEVADIITYQPDRNFDVIIFNEAFYYIPDSEKGRVLDLMLDHLNENGLIITSIYREGHGCWEYFKENKRLQELDFTSITTDNPQTYWKIGGYKKQ